jgi:hypothetical protein
MALPPSTNSHQVFHHDLYQVKRIDKGLLFISAAGLHIRVQLRSLSERRMVKKLVVPAAPRTNLTPSAGYDKSGSVDPLLGPDCTHPYIPDLQLRIIHYSFPELA